MKVLVVGHTAPGGSFTVGSHHLTRELAARGHHVVHLSSPVSLLHAVRLRDLEVRRRVGLSLRAHEAAPGARGLLPLTVLPMSLGPFHSGPAALRTALPSLRRQLASVGMGAVDVLLVDQPLAAGLERLVPAGVVAYRATDLVETRAKVTAERRLVARSDALVATSSLVLDRLREQRADASALPVPSLVLENGVDFRRFEDARGSSSRRGAVYIGAVDDRFDWDTVVAVARGRPDLPVDVYGPRSVEVPDLPSSVTVHAAVPYEETPRLMREASIGLLPLRCTPMNRGRSPMKLFEYLAAGLQVLTTLPPSIAPCPPGVHVLGDPDGVGDVVTRALDAGVNVAGVQAARAMDWDGRAERLEAFLEGLLAGVPG